MKGKGETVERLRRFLAVARGEAEADIMLYGGQVVDVFTGEVRQADVVIKDGRIAGVGEGYERAKVRIDVRGLFIAPGFIDGHIHIESSLLSIPEFVRLCLIHGTTAVVADPHEIANVLGVKGVEYIIKASAGMPIDILVMASPCVPATRMETAGAELKLQQIGRLLKMARVIGLAEVMNYPAVVAGDKELLQKIIMAQQSGKTVDGHSPGLSGMLLQAYAGTGIGSDHECVGPRETREKLRAGMRILIREGSAAHNLLNLLSVVNDFNLRRCCIVSDDRHPQDLYYDGHLDAVLRRAVAAGLQPVAAIQMITLNPAEYFRLHDRGAVAPGYRADLTLLENLSEMRVRMVFKDGKLVADGQKVLVKLPVVRDDGVCDTVRLEKIALQDLAIKATGNLCNVIRVVPGQIITERHIQKPTVKNGYVVADSSRDLLKLVVIERHKATGRMGKGLVAGFGLKIGALGTTVAHDSHNLMVVGTNDEDVLVAIKVLKRMGGGFVAVAHRKVAASLALPIAGLMSTQPAVEVIANIRQLLAKAHTWGSKLENPFITLSFLGLPVIPELRLTDRGLIDVNRFEPIDLFIAK